MAYRKPRSSRAKSLHYAAREISRLKGSLPSPAHSSTNCLRAPVEASLLLDRLAREKAIDGGIALSRFDSDRPNDFRLVTETNTRAQIDALVEGLES